MLYNKQSRAELFKNFDLIIVSLRFGFSYG